MNTGVGTKITAHGTCFAYICTDCTDRVNVSRLFQTEAITRVQATLEHAYCYCCYQGLDGSEANFDAYRVNPAPDGQRVPTAFSLLEVGLACEALTSEPTVARVQSLLIESGMNWSKISIQVALHAIFPDAIGPVFIEKETNVVVDSSLRFFDVFSIQVGDEVVVSSYMGWETTIVAEIDIQHQRLRCLSYEGVQRYGQAQTEEERQRCFSDHTLLFWYNCQGQVLSEKTWKPLKRTTPETDILQAGHIYPLTHEVRKTMRVSAKRQRLNFFTSLRLYWAIDEDWRGGIDEKRLDFLLDWLEKGLAEMVERFGDNGADPSLRRSSD